MESKSQSSFLDEAAARVLREELASGRTLPASWYTDPAVFAAEEARIFTPGWRFAGRVDQLARPGDYITCRNGRVPVVIVRDETSTIRAFANVCGHRGSELVLDACGHRKTLQCHYHAWTWNLNGALRAAPRSDEQPGFDKSAFPLRPVAVGQLGPFLFVNTSPDPIPFERVVGRLPEIIANAGADLSKLKHRGRLEYRIAANWKVVTENYLECYHCYVSHPGFADLIDLDRYEVVPHEYFSVQRGPIKGAAREKRDDLYAGQPVQDGIYNFVWPLFAVNIYPGPGNASTNIMMPIDADNTLVVYEFYFADEMPDADREEMIAFIDQVQREDIVICESVQRGLASGFYRQGQLILSRENGIQHFQRLVFDALAGA